MSTSTSKNSGRPWAGPRWLAGLAAVGLALPLLGFGAHPALADTGGGSGHIAGAASHIAGARNASVPAAPVVSSTDYPECAGSDRPDDCSAHGAVGAPGTFILRTADTDVVAYTYGLDERPITKSVEPGTAVTTISLTPTERGVNGLTVRAWNAAGIPSASTTYFFKVGVSAPVSGAWAFDEGSGTTGADSAGPYAAILSGGAGWSTRGRVGSALDTDGTSGYASVPGTALDTSTSFTISGWARLTSGLHDAVVVSRSGVHGSAFALAYSAARHAWVFERSTDDSSSPTLVRSVSTATPLVGVWTHVAGVYDSGAGTLQLYVNGVAQGTPVSFTTPWKATGELQIARGRHDGAYGSYFPGQIDEVRTWGRTLTAQEMADLQAEEDPATGQARPALAAEWKLDETDGGAATDSSGFGHTAVVGAGGTWVTDESGKGNVLSLDGGSTASAATTGPVVDSQGDFPVTAWARLDAESLSDTSIAHTVALASQSGATREAWGLWYSQPAGSAHGMWVFGRAKGDAADTEVVTAPRDIQSAQLSDPGVWTMVTGVYDGAHHQLLLYVDGVRQGGQGDTDIDDTTGDGIVFTHPWQATGDFSIGSRRTSGGAYGDHATGLIDDVRVWTGVMSAGDVSQLYVNELPLPL